MHSLRALLIGDAPSAPPGLERARPRIARHRPRTAAPRRRRSRWTTSSGEPWSAPTYPVDCRELERAGDVHPDDPANVTPSGASSACSSTARAHCLHDVRGAHSGASRARAARQLLVEYGCSLGDVVCLTFENAGRGMALSATGDDVRRCRRTCGSTPSSLLWSAAVGEWSFWQWAILIITFGAMVWAIAAAVVSGDRGELVGALVRSFIAIPAVPISLWLTGHLLNAVDDMTWYIMNRDGPLGLFSTLQSVMWAGGQANYFFAFLIHGLLMIGMLLLMLVFAFRNIVLAALIAVGPVAWMLFPVRGIGPQWVVRYVSAVVVLLLTGPLTIGFVTLIINGLATVKTIWDPQSWPLLVGLALVAFAPFAIFGLFSFVGAVAADGVGSRLGSHGGRMAAGAARSAVADPHAASAASPPAYAPAAAAAPAGRRRHPRRHGHRPRAARRIRRPPKSRPGPRHRPVRHAAPHAQPHLHRRSRRPPRGCAR